MRVYEVYNAKDIGELRVYVVKSGKIASYRWRLKLNVDEESKFESLDPFLDIQRVCLAVFTRRRAQAPPVKLKLEKKAYEETR